MASVSYKLTLFKDLCAKYPTWSELRTYLDSEHMIINYESEAETSRYCIVRYNKKSNTSSELATTWKRWFRSVVWDTETNRPVCVAAPKASDGHVPSTVETKAELYLDGFMFNRWRDASGNNHISTRSSIGATGTFHSKKPFAQLIQEAIDGTPVDEIKVDDKCTFSSFIAQHQENRIISPVEKPYVWLIHSGYVEEDCTVVIVESDKLPAPYLEDPSWKVQGTVYKDGNGNRWRVRNSAYLMVKSLRGNDSRPDVRYIRLRQQRMLDTYLYYYPEEAETFKKYELSVQGIIEQLHDMYVKAHIRKEGLDTVDKLFKPHVYALHGHYLSVLKPKGFFIRQKEVREYIDKLPWQRLVFMMTRA
jgi:hypothetical protein